MIFIPIPPQHFIENIHSFWCSLCRCRPYFLLFSIITWVHNCGIKPQYIRKYRLFTLRNLGLHWESMESEVLSKWTDYSFYAWIPGSPWNPSTQRPSHGSCFYTTNTIVGEEPYLLNEHRNIQWLLFQWKSLFCVILWCMRVYMEEKGGWHVLDKHWFMQFVNL